MEMQSKARHRISLLTLRLWGQVIILNFASDLLPWSHQVHYKLKASC